MRLVAQHVQRCSEADRRALEVLLGIGTEQAEDSTEAAWRTGMSPGAISNAVRRLGDRLRADQRAIRARRVLLPRNIEERLSTKKKKKTARVYRGLAPSPEEIATMRALGYASPAELSARATAGGLSVSVSVSTSS